jgi:homospermidine synthase
MVVFHKKSCSIVHFFLPGSCPEKSCKVFYQKTLHYVHFMCTFDHLTSAPKSGDVELQIAPKLAVASMASTAKLPLGK